MNPTEQKNRDALDMVRNLESRSKERREKFEKIKKNLRATSVWAIVLIVTVGAICELLSLADLGWILSWLFSLLMWQLVEKKTSLIMREAIKIREFAQELEAQLKLVGKSAGDIPKGMGSSYLMTFVRDTIIAQLVELIPVVDALPFYLGQFVKAYIDQRKARMGAQKIVVFCERAISLLEQADSARTRQTLESFYGASVQYTS